MKSNIIFFSVLLFHTFLVFGQNGYQLPPNVKSGHCYAKSYVKPVFTKDTLSYPILKKEFHESGFPFDTVEIVTKPGYWNIEMLEKVSGLGRLNVTEVSPAIRKIVIALDTTDKSVFTIEKFSIETLQSGGNLEWQEIVCSDRVTAPYLEKIEQKLKDNGYLQDTSAIILNWIDIKEAIVEYQIDNDLPAIHFNRATIEHMGLHFIDNPIKIFSHSSVEVQPTYELPVFKGKSEDCISCIELVYETVTPEFVWKNFHTNFDNLGKRFSRKNYSRSLEPISGFISRIPIVIDKTKDEYINQVFERNRILHLPTLFEMKEMPYGKLNKKRVRKICGALQANGYFKEGNCKMKKMTPELGIAIVKYQIDNKLYLGGISLETIEKLGVEW